VPYDVLPTAAEVKAKGSLKFSYFPSCANDTALTNLINDEITDQASDVKLTVVGDYTSDDEDVLRRIHRAILFQVLGELWQQVLNTMLAYDDEELPPEFVDPGAAADNRDKYFERAKEILARYADVPISDTPKNLPYVGFAGEDESGDEAAVEVLRPFQPEDADDEWP